jgi:tRNA pseudouridine13 synthase
MVDRNTGYIIKQQPEDFIVKEISKIKLVDRSGYAVFCLKKKNCTTEAAVQRIAEALGTNRKSIGYAGSKDSRAVTEQMISVRGISREKMESIRLNEIHLSFAGFTENQLSLGDLEGNEFEITVRNITKKPEPLRRIINYFGEQRFSTDNADIGKAIIKKDFKRAVEMLLAHTGKEEGKVREFISGRTNDYVGALKTIPWKNLMMYIHAYQSKIWNEAAKRIIENENTGRIGKSLQDPAPAGDAITLPIVGFTTELKDDDAGKIIGKIMEEEGVTIMDFVIRAIPDLSSAGSERTLFANIHNLSIGEPEDDELNPGMKKILVKFSLGKGSYATEVIKELFSGRA